MRNLVAFSVLFAPLALLGCSEKKATDVSVTSEAKTQVAVGIGTPKPAFVGEAPAGAYVTTGTEIGRYGGTLILAAIRNPSTFNPVTANETTTTELITGTVFSPLWRFNQYTQEEEPSLCESFERTEDGLTYTFTLREGLRWSDGAALTTDDVEFTYRAVTDPNVATSQKDLFRQGKDDQGNPIFPTFTKVDDRVFKFGLHKIDVIFQLSVGSLYVVPRHKLLGEYEKGEFNKAYGLKTPVEEIVSSGPFRIDAFAPDERLVLERNPHYWRVDQEHNRLPYLDRVVFVSVPDFNVTFLKFRNGETDLIKLRTEHYDLLKREESKNDYTIYDRGPAFNTAYLMFNLDPGKNREGEPYVDPIKFKWFTNKNFRKAISHAIDREGMVKTVLHGRGQPLWSFSSPANKKWAPSKVVTYPFDLDRARQLLGSEGFTERDGQLHDADGHPVEFTMMTNSENETRIGHLNVIKDDLKKLGINAHVRPVPFNDLISSLRGGRTFDAILLGWAAGVPPDPSLSRNIYLSSGRSHYWHPNQQTPATPWERRIDELIYKNVSVFDYAERKRYSDEIQYIISDWQPQIMLVVENSYIAGRHYVGNFMPASLRPQTHWNIYQLYLKSDRKR